MKKRNQWLAIVLVLAIEASAGVGDEGLADRFVAEARESYASEPYRDYTKSVLDRKDYRGCDAGSQRNDIGGQVVRWIDVEGTANFRDIGGWTGLRTGRVYRGAEANCHTNAELLAKLGIKCHNLFATERGLRTLSEELAIRTDLDLRGRGESPTPDATPIPGAQLVRIPCSSYTNLLRQTEIVAKILRVFADKRNYPVYVHCYGGADRTGSVCALLEGLCGVAEEDLSIDFELTSFSRVGRRPRYDRHYFFASMIRELKQRPGATLREQIEDFVVRECGLAPDEVAAIRHNLADASFRQTRIGSRRR